MSYCLKEPSSWRQEARPYAILFRIRKHPIQSFSQERNAAITCPSRSMTPSVVPTLSRMVGEAGKWIAQEIFSTVVGNSLVNSYKRNQMGLRLFLLRVSEIHTEKSVQDMLFSLTDYQKGMRKLITEGRWQVEAESTWIPAKLGLWWQI